MFAQIMVLAALDQVVMLDFQIWIMRSFWSAVFWTWNLKFVLGTTRLGTERYHTAAEFDQIIEIGHKNQCWSQQLHARIGILT